MSLGDRTKYLIVAAGFISAIPLFFLTVNAKLSSKHQMSSLFGKWVI